MADDFLTKVKETLKGKAAASPPESGPSLPPSLAQHQGADGRMPYEAFDNKVRAMNIEIRCWRTALSYSIAYAHMSGIVCEFVTGKKLSFDGNGYGFIIKGQNVGDILRAINLHTCGFIQDFDPRYFIRPEPIDPKAAFVESIDVRVLRPPPRAEDPATRADAAERKAKADETA